ncbi:Nuf2 family-domain-containing protein [Mycena rebaudengoi]|nr:Nuf2 family-domain-containing protein [Mycena rebaudengoi]
MAKYSFPSMSHAEIISSLAAWGVSIAQEQLTRPNPDFVEGVYSACLQQVTKISHDALRDPVQRLVSEAQMYDKDLHATSTANIVLLYHLTRFARAAKVDDFCLKDIAFPERERTIFLLSAFINFVKFTEEFCDPFVKKLRDRSHEIVSERDRISRRLAEITQEIDVMQARIAEDEPRCEQLRTENTQLRARMFATKEIQLATVQEVEQLKAEKTALVQRKEALNGEVASISDAMTRTRSRIVQSPERIKRTITTMTSTAIEDKQMVAMHETKARDLQAKINALSNIEKDVRGCVEQLQTIEKEVRSLEDSQKELHELKDLLEGKEIERKELSLKQERVQKQLSNAQEKLERAQRHAEDRKVASQKTIDRLQREYDEMAIERRDNDKQVEEIRGEANELEKKMAEHLKLSEMELNELLAEYWKLRHDTALFNTSLDLYMETLANKLNMRVAFD